MCNKLDSKGHFVSTYCFKAKIVLLEFEALFIIVIIWFTMSLVLEQSG